MLIAVINQSTSVTNDQVNTMCQAIQIQLNLHVLPAWNMKASTVKAYTEASKIPGYAWIVYVIDNDAQVAGALGFHQEASDQVTGYIMCEPILTNGGVVMDFDSTNPGAYTVSGTLSHEIIEMVGDRFTNTFCDNGTTSWCQELCDPVEQIGYGIMVGTTNVSVSDFVFPNFFNPQSTVSKNGPFNYLKSLQAPFTILAGGYAIQRTGGPGTETQVFGESMPLWRRDTKRTEISRGGRITMPLVTSTTTSTSSLTSTLESTK